MLCRSTIWLQGGGGAGVLQGGKVVSAGSVLNTLIQPSVVTGEVDQLALKIKAATALAHGIDEEQQYTPQLARKWVRAPISELSTSVTRRDWFRLMSFNLLVDSWSPQECNQENPSTDVPNSVATTTPVGAVQVRVPSFARADTDLDSRFINYDPAIDKELPPFLEPSFRRVHLVNQLRHYDPDIVCLNEVNKSFFHGELWRHIRYWGYGTLFQSSRGAGVRALRPGDDPTAKRNEGCVPAWEDVGNVVLFHKGRFFPLMMLGRDLGGRRFHFAQFVGLRDKVTNMTVYVACVQLTAGDTTEAADVRLHEIRQVLTILDAIVRNDSDRSHMTTLICGDFNNESDDEPCVEAVRERFFSTYDLVGGPRWTAWHYRDAAASGLYDKYFKKNYEEMLISDPWCIAEEEVRRFARSDTGNHGKSSRVRLVREQVRSEKHPWLFETRVRSETAAVDERVDQLALIKESMKERGIVYRTQDFIFYDPRTLALHQVLDVPSDDQIDLDQLFPNSKLPSHHIPLMIDVSLNDTFPDVSDTSLKP